MIRAQDKTRNGFAKFSEMDRNGSLQEGALISNKFSSPSDTQFVAINVRNFFPPVIVLFQ